ncbi:MAG: DUF1553 domain-containing protein, partial [Verrucomicrobiaceae bacterium]|nr:DUF1553 domain-containing protein [Verrucomicrobiaceae bacterium]
LAGDLLPKPTRDQLVATGFCRNSMANDEGGIDDEEFRVEFIVDRLDAISNTWMGLSLGCAQCHDHKYDPISQREFYQLFAFFNNSPENGLTLVAKPQLTLPVPTREQELESEKLHEARVAAEKAYKTHEAQITRELADWAKTLASIQPAPTRPGTVFSVNEHPERVRAIGDVPREKGVKGEAARFDNTQHLEVDGALGLDADKPWSIALWMKGEDFLSCVFSKVEPTDEKRGVEVIWLKGELQVNLVSRWGIDAIEVMATEPLDKQDWNLVVLSYDGSNKAAGLKLRANGRELPLKVNRDNLTGSITNNEPLRIGRRDKNLGFYGLIDDLRVLNRVVGASEAADWFHTARGRFIAQKTDKTRTTREKEWLLERFMAAKAAPSHRAAYESLQLARKREADHQKRIPTTLIMRENATLRDTHLLVRGQWNAHGDKVTASTPAALPPMRNEWSRNRLGLARWLVSPENPLTARVIVNRLWQQCFGEGLVRTVNDFGSQGEAPTHPELLDWLAVKFMQSGWDVKAMLKLIVMSEAYQQSSTLRDSKLDDPENRWLARGPSFRLSAEALRDQALSIAGLLSPRVGGPSVMPWQPPGVWEAVSYNAEESYVPDTGENAYRRTLYSYWKRQSPPPATLTFDGPTREKCSVRRARTNTPLQALVMLNDENFMRAAEALAKRSEGQRDRIAWMFRAATCREAAADELELLRGLFARQKSLVVVAQTILNLDEVITRR